MSRPFVVLGEHPAPWRQPSEFRRHDDFHAAYVEACRLARQHPGVRFGVYEECAAVRGIITVENVPPVVQDTSVVDPQGATKA